MFLFLLFESKRFLLRFFIEDILSDILSYSEIAILNIPINPDHLIEFLCKKKKSFILGKKVHKSSPLPPQILS